MGGLLSGLGAAGGDLAGSVVTGLFGRSSAKDSMKFQEHMSNTAYQRAARDLEKAGLNRVLALGSPASTPSGATATMPDPKIGSAFQAGSSAKSQRNVQEASKGLIEEQQKTEQQRQLTEGTTQDLQAQQAAAIALELPSKIRLNNANASSALTASKRGSFGAEVSDSLKEAVDDVKANGLIPTVIDRLPDAVLGPKGVSSARSIGRWFHDKLHGTTDERNMRIERKWDKRDSAIRSNSAKQIRENKPKKGNR